MIQQDVDDVPDVRSRMISAVLIGGGIVVRQGQRTGEGATPGGGGIPLGLGFRNIPTCASPGETGCVIAYSSFDKTGPPGANALFGRAAEGFETACVNPATIAGNAGRFRGSYFPLQINQVIFRSDQPNPDVTTPFALYRDTFAGACVHSNGFTYLEISLELAPGDRRAVPPYRNTIVESLGFGLHLVDFNLPLDDLIDAVAMQAAAAR
jgi:hypothetical protein